MDLATTSNLENDSIKIVILGNERSGKSKMVLQYLNNKFTEDYLTTMGADFRFKTITRDQEVIKLHIWDIAGGESFRLITHPFYQPAQGYLVVYDVTDEQSFKDVENWIQEIKKHGDENALIALVGNKTDLEEHRKVTHEQGQELANVHGAKFYEVSAKSLESVTIAFEGLVFQILEKNSSQREEEKKEKQTQDQRQSETTLMYAKVVVVGDAAVGKSCFLDRSASLIVHHINQKQVRLQLWDIGVEACASILSYHGAAAAIIVYDITNRKSFEGVEDWLNTIKNFTGENIVRVLVGNKCDLVQERQVSEEEGKQMANKNGMLFYEVSAKDSINLDNLFWDITKKLV